MQYVHYEEEIVLKRGVKLVGWTYDKIINPSSLSSAVQPLCNLHDALKQGQCCFMPLSPQELNKLKVAYQERVRQGQVVPHQCKPHKDKGVQRRKAMDTPALLEDDSDEVSGDDGSPPPQKRQHISESDDNSEDSD